LDARYLSLREIYGQLFATAQHFQQELVYGFLAGLFANYSVVILIMYHEISIKITVM